MKNKFDLGVAMARARIQSSDEQRDAEALAERKRRREELLAQERPKRVSWFWSRLRGWRKK